MNRDKIPSSLLMTVTITSLIIFAPASARANTPPPWTVSLDANSSSTSDATIESSHNMTSFFNIGAIINASSTHPVNNVYGWQFSIIYDNRSVLPSGGQNGPNNGVQFGAQATSGNPNWAGRISTNNAFGPSNLVDVDSNHRKVTVAFSLLGQTPPVTIAPILSPTVQGNLLANVNFTLLHNPTSNITFNITDMIFVDSNTQTIPNINPGSPITENPSNTPSTPNPPSTSQPFGSLYIIAGIVAIAILVLLLGIRLRKPRPTASSRAARKANTSQAVRVTAYLLDLASVPLVLEQA